MTDVAKTLTRVAAMGANRAIGHRGAMPWHLPGELQHFKRVTLGKTIVMGRKTWEAIGRPLPGRQNIVVTRNPDYPAADCTLAHWLDDAVRQARSAEVMIIGGGELFRQALPQAHRMILTIIDYNPEADTWFPEWAPDDWRLEDSRQVLADAHNAYDYQVLELTRTGPG